MQISEQVMELLIVECGTGHCAVAVEHDGRQAIVGGRRAGGHRFDFGDGLKTGAMESVGGSGVMTFCASQLVNGSTAGFFGGPLRGWL